MLDLNLLLYKAIIAAIKAGDRINEIYETDFNVIIKSDYTPVTVADQEANQIIENELKETSIPVLGEEGIHFDYELRKNWELLWIVDPLDGTKEFVKRNGEFTVNIGLCKNGLPILGVIFSPVFKDLYFSGDGIGSFKMDRHTFIKIKENLVLMDLNTLINNSAKLPLQDLPTEYTIIASRSHHNPELKKYIQEIEKKQVVKTIYSGSSIKMCWVAEGIAHEYPRFGRTMEWDTCAGHCILKNAGGNIYNIENNTPLIYNKEKISNPNFIARIKS
jgi:3'(2'), 5'-bisphosphate nucleotidase